jgi:hypothetical protein
MRVEGIPKHALGPTTLTAKYWTDRKTTGTMDFTKRIDEVFTRFVDARRTFSVEEERDTEGNRSPAL